MKLNAFLFIGLLCGVSAVHADGIYKVVEWKVPATVYPGQEVIGKFKVQVVDPGKPVYDRPFVEGQQATTPPQKIPDAAFRMTPWYLSKDQKPGDILWVGFTWDVPMDFPEGPVVLDLVMTRNVGKNWDYAALQDKDEKAVAGDRFKVKIDVKANKKTVDAEAVELPLVVKQMARPTMDGKVNPEEWKSAGVTGAFVNNKGSGAVKAPTKVYVGHDAKNLYVSFVCDEPEMAKTGRVAKPGVDRDIYNTNETVYLFLNPSADRTSYMQFIVDILNQRYDALGMDPAGFHPAWESKVWEGPTSWSVEIAMPFTSVTASTPEAGQAWCADFFRLRMNGMELSAWKPTNGDFASPGQFGTLVFDSIEKYLAKELADLNAEAKAFPKELAAEESAWQKKVTSLEKQLSGMSEEEVTAKYASLKSEVDLLKKTGAVLDRKIMQLSGKGFIVSRAQPYELFLGKPMATDEPAGPMQVTMLQDEWVNLAWNLTNVTGETLTLQCLALDGREKKGVDFLRLVLPNITATWYQATPVATGDHRKMWDVIAPIPTGVVEIAPGETAQVWLTLHAPADAKAGAQDMRVMIQPIDGAEVETATIPLNVRVVPIRINAKRYINIFTWNLLHSEVTDNKPWFDAHLNDLVAHGVNVYMLHNTGMIPRPKANPDGTLIGTMDFSKLDRMIDASRGKFDLYYLTLDIWEKNWVRKDLFGLDFNDPNYEKAFKAWMSILLAHLKTKGITNENMIINPYDESTNENCQKIAKWLKEVDPQCKIVIDWSPANMDEAKKMDALTDVWVPHHRNFFQEELQPFHQMIRDSKKPYWCYFYAEGGNEKAQDPTLHYMAKFWWAYENKLVGIGYWAQQYYGDPWNRKASPTYYDTSLVYAFPGGVADSRRWEAWRRGWEDYNLMSILRNRLVKFDDHENLKKLNEYVHDVVATPGDSVKREKVRDWIKARLLMKDL